MYRVKPHNNWSIVHVVDDNPAVRDAICWLVEQVGLEGKPYASAQEFLSVYDAELRGCLVLDIRMPGMSGLELQDRLRSTFAQLPVIIVTGHGDVPITVRAMKAGAYEFLQKPFNDQDLIDAIQSALLEYSEIWRREDEQARLTQNLSSLTPREREVLQHLGLGKPNKVIAYDMGLSVRTVEGYRANIMSKLHVRTIGELMQIVLDAGLSAR
ncbi:response regulator transcription factor [Thiosocius teredinicola]|uniref:response regulator transcription factor n=1 Tax=Thiosocius teredinicola TaxID=1973002 RepID=UPI000990ABE4